MNNNLTELVYIIDMSGSMSPLRNDTIGGYNAMIETQRQLSRDNPALKAYVTTVFFDDRYIVVHDREDLTNIKDITEEDYCPRGSTAMLDAIAKTVIDVGKKLADTPEEERPGLVSVSIITDGYENASREFSWEAVRAMIKEQKEKYSWLFTFVGANIDVEKTVLDLGIDVDMSATFASTADSVKTVYCAHSEGITQARNAVALYCDVTQAKGVYSVALGSITH